MSSNHSEDYVREYHIPANIFDGFSFVGIKARYWLEAAIFAVLPGFVFWKLADIKDLTTKVILLLVVCVPIAIFALIGYNGETLTQFVKTFFLFRKNRRVLQYTIPDEDFAEVGPFDEQEKAIEELKGKIKEIRDRSELKALKAELRELEGALLREKNEYRKKEEAEDTEKRKKREKRRQEQIKAADALATAEIERLKVAGEKGVNKQKIIKEFREKHVTELPNVSGLQKKTIHNLSTQDFIPIDRIEDRCIVTKSGRFIRILCIAPINFPMLSVNQQNFVIENFAILLKGIPVNAHMKTMAKSADVEGFIERMYEKIEKEKNPKCRVMMEDYIGTLRKHASQNAVSRQFFYIIEFDENSAHRNTTDQDRKRALETACQRAKQHFRRCNNLVYEFSTEADEVDSIYRMFYDQLERFNTFGLNYYDKVDYAYNQAISAPNKEVGASDFIAPLTIDLSHRKYVVIDGVYYGYMYIPTKGFRSNVWGSWLFSAINAGGGIDVDIFYERGDKDRIRSAARRQINLSAAQIKDMHSNSDAFDALASKTQSANYIKNGLSSGEDFYYVTVLITVIAMSENTLLSRMDALKALFDEMDMRLVGCDFHQEEAFLASLPLCRVPSSIYELGRRNMLTHDAAATYPFSSYELMDDNGILVGINLSNGSLVMPDVFDTKKYKNANMFIVGGSGAGKTYNLMTQAMRSREAGIQTFILAPLKGHEFKRACEAMGGQYIKLSPGSPHCINVMAIRKRDEEAVLISRLLDGTEDESILSEKISSLETLFAIMIPDISNEEEQLLNGHIVETYRKYGITSDNESLKDPIKIGEYKTMPTLADLHKQMESDPHMERVRNIMSRYVTGSAQNFSQPTNVSLENDYTVIDVSALNKKMMPIGMFIALDFMWDKIKENRTKSKRLFIDEIWHLMGAGAPVISAEFVQEIFKTIRGFGGGAVAVTQELQDFFALNGGIYGKAILNACTLGMIMKLEITELKMVREHLELEQHEADTVQGFEKGQALIIGAGNSVAVKIIASSTEHDLITTSAEDLRRIARTKQLEEAAMEERRQAPAEDETNTSSHASNGQQMTPGEIMAASRRNARAGGVVSQISRKKVKL